MAAGAQLAGGVTQGIAQFESGKTRSELLNTNAEIADAQARSEEQAGGYNANLVRLRGARQQGQQVASIGGNNLQQGGTNALVVAGAARMNELDALQTQNNALRRAWGFDVQATSDREQSGLAEEGGLLSGLGSLINAGGRYYAATNRPQPTAED